MVKLLVVSSILFVQDEIILTLKETKKGGRNYHEGSWKG
jgi:hypothetical protein